MINAENICSTVVVRLGARPERVSGARFGCKCFILVPFIRQFALDSWTFFKSF